MPWPSGTALKRFTALASASRTRMIAIRYFSLTGAHRFSTAFTQDGCYGWRPGWNSQALLMVAVGFSHRAEMAMVRSYYSERRLGLSELAFGGTSQAS